MTRYQGLHHTNEKNELLIRFQDLDCDDNRKIFPLSLVAGYIKKALFIQQARKKNNNS